MLGTTNVMGREAITVRLWVRILSALEDEETAIPDTQTGLRVTRRIKCAANPNNPETYSLTQAGLSSGVQWLLRAEDSSQWLVLVTKRGVEKTFVALGQLKLAAYPSAMIQKYVLHTIARKQGPLLSMSAADTPLKRKQLITDNMPAAEAAPHGFNERMPIL